MCQLSSPKPEKFQRTPYSSQKIMATVLAQEAVILEDDLMKHGQTITADV